MTFILDTCSIINLAKGTVLEVTLAIPEHAFAIGPLVRGECVELADEITEKIESGQITLLDDSILSASRIDQIATENNLGVGESEGIAFCEVNPGLTLCTDDRRARAIASQLLGQNRVVGTEDLLLLAVTATLLAAADAFRVHELMRARGAFLPERDRAFFAREY